jgi:hypothetical protein
VGFPAKTDAARPAVTGFGVELGAVNERGHRYILGRGPSKGLWRLLWTTPGTRSAPRPRGKLGLI